MSIKPETVSKLTRAAKLEAVGKSGRAIAKAMGVSAETIKWWKRTYGELWQSVAIEEKRRIIEAVCKTAGTDAVLSDVDRFLEMAGAADRWAAEKGKPLFMAHRLLCPRLDPLRYPPETRPRCRH